MTGNKLVPAKIILVLIILISFGTVMGVIGYSLSLKNNPPVAVQPIPTPNDKTVDWNSYRNEKYGYELKYPPQFIILNEEINKDAVHWRESEEYEGGLDIFVGKTINNSIDGIEQSIDEINQASVKEFGNARYIKLQNITINSSKGIILKDSYTIGDWNIVAFIPHEGYLFKIGFMNSSEALSQILSTFKFTDQNSSFSCSTSTVSDIDGNTYNTVQIGSQCWLKENLKVTKNSQGKPITRYCYNNDSEICDTDGGLYDWNTAMNNSIIEGAQGICLAGWHIPKDSEWHVLENYLTDEGQNCLADRSGWGCEFSGVKLKVGGSSGFEAFLAGYHQESDVYPNGLNYTRGDEGNFWSSNFKVLYNEGYPWYRHVGRGITAFSRDTRNKDIAHSVRCLKD